MAAAISRRLIPQGLKTRRPKSSPYLHYSDPIVFKGFYNPRLLAQKPQDFCSTAVMVQLLTFWIPKPSCKVSQGCCCSHLADAGNEFQRDWRHLLQGCLAPFWVLPTLPAAPGGVSICWWLSTSMQTKAGVQNHSVEGAKGISMPVVCHQSRELSRTDQDKTLYQNSTVIPTTQHSLHEGVSHIFPGRTTIPDYLQKSTSSHEHIAARTGAKRCHWEWKWSVSLVQDFSEPLICYCTF